MAYKNAASANGQSTAPSATLSGAPALNDIILWVCGGDADNRNITPPAGFTSLASGNLSGLDNQSYQIAWKRAGGSEGTTYTGAYTGGAGATAWCCGVILFDGRDTTNPPTIGTVTLNTTNNASPITITAPGVTALAGDDIAWIAIPDNTGAPPTASFTPPSLYTERVDQHRANDFADLSVATRDAVSAGATGSVAGIFTCTGGAGWAAALVRVPAGVVAASIVPIMMHQSRMRRN